MEGILKKITESIYYKALIFSILIQGFFVTSAFADEDGTPIIGRGGSVRFENPLGANSLGGFIDSLLGLLVQLSVPVIALFIIYAGFLMVTARGNEGQLEKAKKTLLYTMVGAAIVLGARVISGIITGTLLSL